MKKKFIIINLLLSLTVLLSMLFQTIHSYEHIFQQITEKTCEHKYTGNQKEITHSHSVDSNNCPICHFTFSTFIPNSSSSITFCKAAVVIATAFFYAKTSSTFFKGSLFALRAPPLL